MPWLAIAGSRFPRLRAACYGIAGFLLLMVILHVTDTLFGQNVHTVLPERLYRCAQPSPKRLHRFVAEQGIRTVINLRGPCPLFDWYVNECRTTRDRAVNQEDITLSSSRLPPPDELRRLVDVLEHAEYPILLHCQRGIDRTGLAAGVARLLAGHSLDEARQEIHPLWHGQVPFLNTVWIPRFFDLYERWLHEQHLVHSADVFRRWATQEYRPAQFQARLELLDWPASLPPRQPRPVTLRATNTSIDDWQLQPGTGTGVHAKWIIVGLEGRFRREGYLGLFRTTVRPGESIDLTLPMPALPEPGLYWLYIDMADRRSHAFAQVGSEPLYLEIRVR